MLFPTPKKIEAKFALAARRGTPHLTVKFLPDHPEIVEEIAAKHGYALTHVRRDIGLSGSTENWAHLTFQRVGLPIPSSTTAVQDMKARGKAGNSQARGAANPSLAASTPMLEAAAPWPSVPAGAARKSHPVRAVLVVMIGLGVIGAIGSAFTKQPVKSIEASPIASSTTVQLTPQQRLFIAAAEKQQQDEAAFKAAAAQQGAIAAAHWYPQGFSEWRDDSTIAYQYRHGSCNVSSACFHVAVISRDGCPNGIYVEMNVEDANRNVIGYTNSILPSLAPEQGAVLELDAVQSNVAHGEVTRIDCH